jgi:hypothetical protein
MPKSKPITDIEIDEPTGTFWDGVIERIEFARIDFMKWLERNTGGRITHVASVVWSPNGGTIFDCDLGGGSRFSGVCQRHEYGDWITLNEIILTSKHPILLEFTTIAHEFIHALVPNPRPFRILDKLLDRVNIFIQRLSNIR